MQELIESTITPGYEIISDDFSFYKYWGAPDSAYRHSVVNHSIEYVAYDQNGSHQFDRVHLKANQGLVQDSKSPTGAFLFTFEGVRVAKN